MHSLFIIINTIVPVFFLLQLSIKLSHPCLIPVYWFPLPADIGIMDQFITLLINPHQLFYFYFKINMRADQMCHSILRGRI